MKLERYFTMMCVLVIACCFAIGCEQMQKPTMDMVGMVTEPETPAEPETPETPPDPTMPETPPDPAMPTAPETPMEPETPPDPYASLPEIAMSAELEPGQLYRISNAGGSGANFEVIRLSKVIDRVDLIVVGITLNPPVSVYDVTSNKEELVIEIIRKIEVVEKVGSRGPYTSHEYEGRIVKNLSRPEIVFEYEEDDMEGDDG